VRLAGTVRKESMLRTKETAGPDNAGPAEELLERLETLREDMEDLRVTTLAGVIQRIEELHRKLDNQQ